jgi:hypothetical protein
VSLWDVATGKETEAFNGEKPRSEEAGIIVELGT